MEGRILEEMIYGHSALMLVAVRLPFNGKSRPKLPRTTFGVADDMDPTFAMNSRASAANVAIPHKRGGQLDIITMGFMVYVSSVRAHLQKELYSIQACWRAASSPQRRRSR